MAEESEKLLSKKSKFLSKIITKKAHFPKLSSYRQKERSLFWGFISGAVFLLPMVIAAILSNSVVLLADLLKNLSKSLASLSSWLTVRRVAKRKDFSYNFGYGKLENLSSLIIAAVLIISLFVIGYEVFHRLKHPEELNELGTELGLIVIIAMFLINLRFWIHDHNLAKKDHSPIMESQWRLYRAGTIAHGFVILSLLFSLIFRSHSWNMYIDPLGSIIIAGFTLSSAYKIISRSLYDLMDGTLEESLQLIILRELADFFDDYVEFHGIRSRRGGTHIFIEIFLEFDGNKKMSQVQETINKMRKDLEKNIPGSHVVIAPSTQKVI